MQEKNITSWIHRIWNT